jgi:hypothetical protein
MQLKSRTGKGKQILLAIKTLLARICHVRPATVHHPSHKLSTTCDTSPREPLSPTPGESSVTVCEPSQGRVVGRGSGHGSWRDEGGVEEERRRGGGGGEGVVSGKIEMLRGEMQEGFASVLVRIIKIIIINSRWIIMIDD